MPNLDLIYGDAILPRQDAPLPTAILPSDAVTATAPSGADTTGILQHTDGSPAPTTELGLTASRSSTTIGTATGSATSEAATSSSSVAASSGDNGLTTKLVAIIVPIAAVVVAIPIAYILWVRHRTRNMKKLASEPRYSPSPSKEPKFRQSSPKHSPKPSFLPPMFHERETTKEGSLFDDVRVSMESARRTESVSLFDRARDIHEHEHSAPDSSYGVYALRRSLEDKGRTDSIGLFDLPRNTERTSPLMQPQRGPSPTLPSPKVPLFDRPPSEAWPLPAAKLPSPQALYDPHMNTNKPLPAPGSPSNIPPPNGPLPAPPGPRQENPQTYSTASSGILPLGQEYPPSSTGIGRPAPAMFNTGSNSGLHPGHAMNGQQRSPVGAESPSSTYDTPTFSPLTPGEHPRSRQRDSDLVSELSYRAPSIERDPKRKSMDAMSVVSAISHRRRRSERDTDAMSMISALSPDQEDIPRIPTEHYPR